MMTPAETLKEPANEPDVAAPDGVKARSPIGPPPMIRALITSGEAMKRLDRASKRGKLAGFVQRDGDRFRTLVYGEPFDRELLGIIRKKDDGCVIELELRLMKKMPAIAIALIVVSIWPGVWLTDSMIQTYWSGYPNSFWVTAAWYLPITVIPLPWMLRSMWRKSEGIAREEFGKMVEKIVRAVDGTVS